MDTETEAPTLRELMPHGFSTIIAKRTGGKNISTIVGTVNLENPASKYWQAALALAKETDPAGFARWEAARAQPA